MTYIQEPVLADMSSVKPVLACQSKMINCFGVYYCTG